MGIIYAPAVIASIHELTGEEVPFAQQSKGKFVMTLEPGADEMIALYGLLYTQNNFELHGHGDILHIMQKLGKAPRTNPWLLGGAFLLARHDKKLIFASGSSYTLGGVPRALVENTLSYPGYEIDISIDERVCDDRLPALIRNWYDAHDFLERAH